MTGSPKFKTYYKFTIVKMTWYWVKKRHVNEWNITESPKIIPHIYGQLIFDYGIFLTNDAETVGYTLQKIKLHHYLRLRTKINSICKTQICKVSICTSNKLYTLTTYNS